MLAVLLTVGSGLSPLASAQEAESEATVDDTAVIDTESTVDTAMEQAVDERRWELSGDIRALADYADIDRRDGVRFGEWNGLARLRLRSSLSVARGVQLGARLAARCSQEDCGFEWYSDPALPRTNGLEDGQVTFDELYLHIFRRDQFNLTLGRQQTRSVLRAGVFARSLDRVDSNNTRVTWTDGLHFTLRRLEGWETHAIAQYNSSDGSGSIRRGELDFDDSDARFSYFVSTENRNVWGPIVQRSLSISYLPDSLLKDGDAAGRREDYIGIVARGAARWPQRSEGMRFRAGFEFGYAPEVATSDGANIDGRVSKIAWNVTASLMDFKPRHSIGVNYSQTGAGWLLSPNFVDNEESWEIRYIWRPEKFPPVDLRLRWRNDIELRTTAEQKRQTLDGFVRITWNFDPR